MINLHRNSKENESKLNSLFSQELSYPRSQGHSNQNQQIQRSQRNEETERETEEANRTC